MKSQKLRIGDHDVLMETPKHSQVIDAEMRAMDINMMGMPFVNQAKFRTNRVAAAIKYVKKHSDKKDVAVSTDEIIQWLDEIGEDAFTVLDLTYARMVDITDIVSKLKNSEIGAIQPPSKTQSES